MNTNLRYWDYYDMTATFDDLYERSSKGENFNNLYELIISEQNIKLAYRTIKSNKGSKTNGIDGKAISDISEEEYATVIMKIRKLLENYKPRGIKRVLIPKRNGKKRPLGIPCIEDRLIQQMIKQIIEPICEAKFFHHSYGFRPDRSGIDAITRCRYLIDKKYHYVVDIDIKGFFDNVNHNLLKKQLWNIGIRDKRVLTIISKMLKTPIKGIGIPKKGTPQGGILSPLLANIVLNDLDQWIYTQWEGFKTKKTYTQQSTKYAKLKKTKLKAGFLVRYADDFKIFTNNYNNAIRWKCVVEKYINKRLKLEISEEKSKIVNLKKKRSEFLGYELKAIKKKKKYVCRTYVSKDNEMRIKDEYKKHVKKLAEDTVAENAIRLNSYVAGVQNYFKYATMVNECFNRISFQTLRYVHNKLDKKCKIAARKETPESYRKRYKNNYKIRKICNVFLYPMADVQLTKRMSYQQQRNVYTIEGRALIYKNLDPIIEMEIQKMSKKYIRSRSMEYYDNRLSRYSMKKGLCEITGQFLYSEEYHCHHYLPIHLGGTDEFKNLRVLHKEIHKLIHMTNMENLWQKIKEMKLNKEELIKVNTYRRKCKLELVNLENI